MSKPIFIIGAGGHARVLLECLQQNVDIKICGFLEVNKKLIGSSFFGVPIFDQEIILKKYSPKDIFLVNGIGSVDISHFRAKQFNQLKQRGFNFYSPIHLTAYCSKDIVVGEGAQLLARSTILTGSKIGCNTIVNTSASIDHDCNIGDHVHIAPGAILSGGVKIEDDCHIGVGAKIIQGIHIGKNSLVAAGAVVISNLPENSRVAGVPARAIKSHTEF